MQKDSVTFSVDPIQSLVKPSVFLVSHIFVEDFEATLLYNLLSVH